MAKVEQKPQLDINRLKRATELKGKIIDLFSIEELRLMAEGKMIPHYVLTNPLDGRKVTLFLQDEVNGWVADNLQKNHFGFEQNLTFIELQAGAHRVRSTDKIPTSLSLIKNLYWLPDYQINTPPGIYFLCQDLELVYIGQAMNIGNRIAGHRADREKEFNSIYFINCHACQLNDIEKALIRFFKPKLNHREMGNDVTESDIEILKVVTELEV